MEYSIDYKNRHQKAAYLKQIGLNPNIWKFIHILKQEESAQDMRFQRLESGLWKERARNRPAIERDLELVKSKISYKEYLESLSAHMPNYD